MLSSSDEYSFLRNADEPKPVAPRASGEEATPMLLRDDAVDDDDEDEDEDEDEDDEDDEDGEDDDEI